MYLILFIALGLILYFFIKVLSIYFEERKLKKKTKIYEIKFEEFDDYGILEIIFKYNAFLHNWDIIRICKIGTDVDIWDQFTDTEKIMINVHINMYVNDL